MPTKKKTDLEMEEKLDENVEAMPEEKVQEEQLSKRTKTGKTVCGSSCAMLSVHTEFSPAEWMLWNERLPECIWSLCITRTSVLLFPMKR